METRYLLMDRVARKLLAEKEGKFVWAPSESTATVYTDRLDAEWAAFNAGGDTVLVPVHPVAGVTEGCA